MILFCIHLLYIHSTTFWFEQSLLICPPESHFVFLVVTKAFSLIIVTDQGELTMSTDMESLQNAVFLDVVPDSWTKRAYPSMSGLALWFSDLLARIKELEAWSSDFILPSAVWLAGFFNPQSFLTAIMQTMARR